MNFKHYINGIEIEEPEGFTEFNQEIIRDDNEKFIRYNFPLDLTFIGNGYEIIEAQYQLDFNSELEYRSYSTDGMVETLEVIAIIKISNCEFNISAKPKPSVNVQMDDNVFQSKIFNNKKRPFAPTSTETLNGVTITPVPPIDLTFYNSETGVNLSPTRKVYDLFECLKNTILFMSDGAISLESDWYSSLPDDERLAITTGSELRQAATVNQIVAPVIDFETLFTDLHKKYNLFIIVENILTESPTLRLEQEQYTHGIATAFKLSEVDTLVRSLDYNKLYNRIRVGSKDASKEYGNDEPMYYTTLLSFCQETFNIDGYIGVDNELDLVSTYVIDSNEIHKTLLDETSSNDEKVFIIQYDKSTNTATKGEYFPGSNPASRYYNEQLLNLNVIQRYDYLGDVVLSMGNLGDSFRASQVGEYIGDAPYPGQEIRLYELFPEDNTIIEILPYPFQNDSTPPNYNDGGGYDPVLYRFTAQYSGVYRFNYIAKWLIRGTTSTNYKIIPKITYRKNGAIDILPTSIRVNRYDGMGQEYSSFTIQQSEEIDGLNVNEYYYFGTAFSIELQVGDYIDFGLKVSGRATNGNVVYLFSASQGVISSPASPLSGGVYERGNPDNYYVGKYYINQEGITGVDWTALFTNPTRSVQIDTNGKDIRRTYLSKISRNIVSGESTIELIFNRNQTFK